jgi:hypothetical protein
MVVPCDPDAGADVAVRVGLAQNGHAGQQAIRDHLGVPGLDRRQDQRELVPAESRRQVPGPDAVPHGFGDLAQDRVPGGMPLLVVDLLEVVQIDHHHGHRGSIAPGACDLAQEVLAQGPAVGKARQGVGPGRFAFGQQHSLQPGVQAMQFVPVVAQAGRGQSQREVDGQAGQAVPGRQKGVAGTEPVVGGQEACGGADQRCGDGRRRAQPECDRDDGDQVEQGQSVFGAVGEVDHPDQDRRHNGQPERHQGRSDGQGGTVARVQRNLPEVSGRVRSRLR